MAFLQRKHRQEKESEWSRYILYFVYFGYLSEQNSEYANYAANVGWRIFMSTGFVWWYSFLSQTRSCLGLWGRTMRSSVACSLFSWLSCTPLWSSITPQLWKRFWDHQVIIKDEGYSIYVNIIHILIDSLMGEGKYISLSSLYLLEGSSFLTPKAVD